MSAIFGVFGRAVDESAHTAMHAAGRRRGGDQAGAWSGGPAHLGVSRFGWECDPAAAGSAAVARDGPVVVATDASLYYLADLEQSLARAGTRPSGRAPGHWILAAYQAWGARCAERLEGDFAFILWDATQQRAVCARDFGGKRPLFYAESGGSLVVASTIAAVLAAPGPQRELDLAAVAADAAGLFAADVDTCYAGVKRLPAGCTLVWADGELTVSRHWAPPELAAVQARPSFDEAAQELRTLLEQAARERLPDGGASVWLSGGWDSTAVLASSERASRDQASGERLGAGSMVHAVSISYPPGDPGREDELITAAAERWNTPVRWLAADAVPLFDDPERGARLRDEPLAHGFETTTRALARASRAVGTRVAFDGNGGDQLFQVSPVYLADLLREGRWATLAQEWRARGLRGRRTFFRYAVQPLLPAAALRLAAWLRGGRALHSHLDRPLPPWIRIEAARGYQLLERERAAAPPRAGRGAAEYEVRWQLTHAFFPRVFGMIAGFALEEGIELRSPLLDRRVVEFAVGRPRAELAQGRETKRLLRHAMRGLLPDTLLAPRARRTGMPGAYLARSLRAAHAAEVDQLLAAPLALEAVGIADGAALRAAWTRYRSGDDSVAALSLLVTLHAELWMRARVAAG